MNEIEARKARAVALLSAWLREDSPVFGLLDEIRYAVEHMTECAATDPTAGVDEYEWTECLDCKAYREGTPGLLGTRPTLDLLTELGNRLERREEDAA